MTDNTDIATSISRLKILICKPRLAIQTIKLNQFINCEPLEMEYLYTVLQRHEVILLDGMVDFRNPVRIAAKYKVDIVLFTSLITTVSSVLKSARKLKKLKNPPLIFVGGPDAEVVPRHYYSQDIDGVFFADQLEGIVKVTDRIQKNRSYNDIPGGAFPMNGKFVCNPSPPLDPVKLPLAKHVLLEQFPQRYKIIHYKPCSTIKTAFGCTDNCTFCFCTEMHGGVYRARPIRDVVDEIKNISVKHILIVDDNFLTNKKRLLEFCELIKTKKIEKEFIAIGNSRFIARNPDVIRKLREAGLTALMVGFESVTDDELRVYHKKACVSENNRTIEICRDLDIDLFALFIINPNWRHADFRKLAQYLKGHYIPFALFSTLTIFPGTQLARSNSSVQITSSKWWRYDMLRLHQKPRYMSSLMYYLWLFYLYMIPGLRFTTLKKFHKRYGFIGIIRHSVTSFFIGLEYLLKLAIWR